MVSTHLKNISQIWNLPQVGVKIKNIRNHHLAWGLISDEGNESICYVFQVFRIQVFLYMQQFPAYRQNSVMSVFLTSKLVTAETLWHSDFQFVQIILWAFWHDEKRPVAQIH